MENVEPSHEEALDGFKRIHQTIMSKDDDSILFILDASKSKYYSDVSDMWKEAAPALNPKVLKAAVVTENFAIRMAVKAFLVFSRGMRTVPFRDVQIFAKKETAKDWVAS